MQQHLPSPIALNQDEELFCEFDHCSEEVVAWITRLSHTSLEEVIKSVEQLSIEIGPSVCGPTPSIRWREGDDCLELMWPVNTEPFLPGVKTWFLQKLHERFVKYPQFRK